VRLLRFSYQVDSEQECFAINIVRETEFRLAVCGLSPCAATRRLAGEYRSLFGHAMPPSQTALHPAAHSATTPGGPAVRAEETPATSRVS
jgi:hypothetical protein